MKKTSLMAAMAAVVGGGVFASAAAHAQNPPLEVWQPQQGEADPARRVPATAAPAATNGTVTAPADVSTQAALSAPTVHRDLGGFFLGVQAGKGWVYEDIDQSALMVNAGYRWQAGAVALVGLEAAAGKLDSTREVGGVDFTSIGGNARFNFGAGNPVYGIVRAGYWRAEDDMYGDSVDGGYFGAGLGVDVNRHFNLSVVYTNHVYFSGYNDGYLDYDDFSRADTLMLGAEVRF